MMITASNVFAQAKYETIDGLRYLLDANTQKATLVANPDEKYSGRIIIPGKIAANDSKEYTVTALGDNAFNNCWKLDSVQIPNTVETLGEKCFSQCSYITYVTIPSSVTKIGKSCFEACNSLKTITIPSSVVEIGFYCFWGCSNLTSIKLPANFKSIGNRWFLGCKKLKEFTIPSSVTTLEYCCFDECESLTHITIPSTVKYFEWGCFLECYNLTEVYFMGATPPEGEDPKIQENCMIYVPKSSLQAYKDYFGANYKFIYAMKDNPEEGESQKCIAPSISFNNNEITFSCPTPKAEFHYTINDDDIVTDKLNQNGKVKLTATYKIKAYATAEGYQPSETTTATLYWINANLENDPSTNINQNKTRGIVATSVGGIVTLSGLYNGEIVSFYSPDGRLVTTSKAENGIVSCSVSSTMVVARVGGQSLKLIVRH